MWTNWEWRHRLAILFLTIFIITAVFYLGFQGKFKDPMEITKTNSISSVIMSPSNLATEIIYKSFYGCEFTTLEAVSETCFSEYKTAVAISILPGMIIYALLGYVLGLLIEKLFNIN